MEAEAEANMAQAPGTSDLTQNSDENEAQEQDKLSESFRSDSEHCNDNEEDEENMTPEKSPDEKRLRRTSDGFPYFMPPRRNKERRNKFSNILISELKRSGQGFIQDTACPSNPTISTSRMVSQCRECRLDPSDRARKERCRFFAFRKLKYITPSLLEVDGFADPMTDYNEKDLNVWCPSPENKPTDLDPEMAKFLLFKVGDQFCELVQQECDALKYYQKVRGKKSTDDEKIVWRRPVENVREMCDACETTLFNYHWTCPRCGFVVCCSCFKAKKNRSKVHKLTEKRSGRDEYNWFWCLNRKPHELDKLMLSQILPRDVLTNLCAMVHLARESLNIPQYCCADGRSRIVQNNQLMTEFLNGTWNLSAAATTSQTSTSAASLASTADQLQQKKEISDDEENDDDEDDTLELANFFKRRRTETEMKQLPIQPSADTAVVTESAPVKSLTEASTIINSINEVSCAFPSSGGDEGNQQNSDSNAKLLPILITSLAETTARFPGVPHSWLCNGRLLRLHDPNCEGNYGLFQEVWKRGQPVIVSNVSQSLNESLWSPEAFCDDFGDIKHDLVNCATGKLVCGQQMKVFWNGFQCMSKRLRDDKQEPMLLKLKDWPPGDDFKVALPSRFRDLMRVLPVKEYTQRNGRLNLAARLPEDFVRPDLGPKMYIAYGSGTHLDKGTTNLHLDISDAVNLMVYVGEPDEDLDRHNAGIRQAILDSDCEIYTADRVSQGKELPGALWHIYNARDAEKIRDLINAVSLERGIPPKPNHDPIHDQCCYLDKDLRARLKKEYDVVGYPIIQCMGDAVFIPAGAPHQVRNLQNCIKIAEDFVSPENVSHCFHLTEEFRNLSETHTNHEDKLQIKNIIYHAVKDAISVVQPAQPSTAPTVDKPDAICPPVPVQERLRI